MTSAIRRIHWVSSERPENSSALEDLQRRMAEFYAQPAAYYEDIAYAAAAWHSDPHYLSTLRNLAEADAVLEVGCGRANVLTACPTLAPVYTGVDFSEQILKENSLRYPDAHFVPLDSPQKLPFGSDSFDRVFCIYVLEHCVFPQLFLRECLRVLRPGGRFILLCPDFLGRGQMASQRAGFSSGTGRDKLRRGQFADALVTGLDRKAFIPWAAARARRAARQKEGGFWINLQPTCFEDAFYADADAVYLTYEWEILRELERGGGKIDEHPRSDPTRIFLVATKLDQKS